MGICQFPMGNLISHGAIKFSWDISNFHGNVTISHGNSKILLDILDPMGNCYFPMENCHTPMGFQIFP